MEKQYTLIVNELGKAILERLIQSPAIQFLELQGANLNNEGKYNILLTPILPPVPQMQMPAQPVEQPKPIENNVE